MYYYDKKGGEEFERGIRNIILPFKRCHVEITLSTFIPSKSNERIKLSLPPRGIQLKLIISKDQPKIHTNESPWIRYYRQYYRNE